MHIDDKNSIEPKFPNIHFKWENFTIIKSSIGKNLSLALFCYDNSNNPNSKPVCLSWSYINNYIGVYANLIYPYKCKKNYFALNVKYIPDNINMTVEIKLTYFELH